MKRSMTRDVVASVLIAFATAVPALAQTVRAGDDTVLEQIIIFGRHGIRSSTTQQAELATYSQNTFPPFTGVPPGYLTPRGREAARLLGAYFHAYLRDQGLIAGDATADLARSYFHANSIQRSAMTAQKLGEGLIPGAPTIPVHAFSLADPTTGAHAVPDPVFDPILAGVATIDAARAVDDVLGTFGSGAALAAAYGAELSLVRNVLSPLGSVDPTSQATHPFTLDAFVPIVATGGAIDMGGLDLTIDAADPFVMQYADGFPLEDVAWGKLTPETLSAQTRLNVLQINIAMRSPYVNRVQSSNAASHVLRTMKQVVSARDLPGAFGGHRSRLVVVTSSDFYTAGLAGLLGVHWQLPGYQADFCAPAGALVFELRRSRTTKKHIVRVYYTAQTFDQLRNLTPLSLEEPPATMQLTVPGGSSADGNLDVEWPVFRKLLTRAIGREYVQPYRKAVAPAVLESIPLD